MENLITPEVKKVALDKQKRMSLGTFSRLKLNNEISDIVIRKSSSGIYFYNVPGTIDETIDKKLICFKYLSELQ